MAIFAASKGGTTSLLERNDLLYLHPELKSTSKIIRDTHDCYVGLFFLFRPDIDQVAGQHDHGADEHKIIQPLVVKDKSHQGDQGQP